MKTLTFLLLIALSSCTPKTVATLTIQPNRVLYVSADINKVSAVDSIVRIKPGGTIFSKNLKLTLLNGDQKTVSKTKIWGYTDDKGKVWRYSGKSFFQVLRIGDLVEYEIIESRNVYVNNTSNHTVYAPVTVFSKTLDSKIVYSRKRALKDSN